jgi:prepilin-type N-terminal cleavage/methylation domain-containing protein
MIGDKNHRTIFQKIRSSKHAHRSLGVGGFIIRNSTLKSGYSLTELLVVMLLFSFAMVILGQTYIQFLRLSNKTANAATVQQDSRFVLEFITRATRGSEIDYSVPVLAATSSLRLLNQNGDYIEINKSAPGDPLCVDEATVSCLLVTTDSGTTWAPLTAKHVNVDAFTVYVHPTISPFQLTGLPADYPNDQQPFVTINLTLTLNANNPRESFTQSAQTSISSRVYVR